MNWNILDVQFRISKDDCDNRKNFSINFEVHEPGPHFSCLISLVLPPTQLIRLEKKIDPPYSIYACGPFSVTIWKKTK